MRIGTWEVLYCLLAQGGKEIWRNSLAPALKEESVANELKPGFGYDGLAHAHAELRGDEEELSPFAPTGEVAHVSLAVRVIYLQALAESSGGREREKALERVLACWRPTCLVGEHVEARERVGVEADRRRRRVRNLRWL